VRRRALLLALAAPLLLGSPCEPNDYFRGIYFATPPDQAELTHMPLDVEISFATVGDLQTLHVWLDGVEITDRFALSPAAAWWRTAGRAEGVWLESLAPGPHLLQASLWIGDLEYTESRLFTTAGDPFADGVASAAIGTQGGFNAGQLPGIVTGPPLGAGLFFGSLDVFSLGLGGEIVLSFDDNVIVDGPGVDFTVFENAFLTISAGFSAEPFMEPGRVSASQDGVLWVPFPCSLSPVEIPLYHPGCAGVYPVLSDGSPATPHPSLPTSGPPIGALVGLPLGSVPTPDGSGGDSFDLAQVGLPWARYLRIQAATWVDAPTGPTNAGFDLDAVAAVHSAPATDGDGNGVPDAVE
jgi:hypothetical protein